VQKAALYCRLSKEDEEKLKKDDDSESIQNQKLLLTEYAAQKGWQVYKIFVDDDYSGLYEDRPAFRQMIEEAEKGCFQIVLCKSQSRFSREMEQIEKYIHRKFVLWGIRFVSVVDNIDTEEKGNKKARQINGLVNEWYCEDLSENVKAALNSKKKNGQYLGHWCAYGYRLSDGDRHKIEPDEEAAAVVRQIYSLYLEGYGISAIAGMLTQKGVLTPTAYKRSKGINYHNPAEKTGYSQKYGVWCANTVRKILRDKTYLGHLIQGREKKLSYKSKKVIKVPEEDWIVAENNHEAIIDEETFNKVQSRIGVKGSAFKNGGAAYKTHLFAGKARCMSCGSTMQKNHGKNGVIYLRCGLAVKTRQKECTLHTVRMDFLEEAVEKRIHEIINEFAENDDSMEYLAGLLGNEDDLKNTLEKKKAALDEIEQKQKRLYDMLLAAYRDKFKGTLTEESFLIIQAEIDGKMRKNSIDIEELKKETEKTEEKIRSGNGSRINLEKSIAFKGLTHSIVNDFIDYIEIGEKNNGIQEINIHWMF